MSPGKRELLGFIPFAVSRRRERSALHGAKLPSSGAEHPCRAAPAPRAGIHPQGEFPTGKAPTQPLG